MILTLASSFQVASRRVTQVLAIQLIVCAIIGKFGAIFVTIPYPVLGGSAILSFGLFLGIVMSYMQYTDMNSPRNLAVVGVSILVGIMVPNWVKVNFAVIKTGKLTVSDKGDLRFNFYDLKKKSYWNKGL